ncbi:MAG: extracellular solute-binding protein [Candidatus Hinthialibacter antarcticus]|nr:extracellular solute-binding protein [Candidatus Hinthialibacter antarcticus]
MNPHRSNHRYMRSIAIVCMAVCVALGLFASAQAQKKVVTLHITAFEGYSNTIEKTFKALVKEKYDVDVKIELRVANNPDDIFNDAKSGRSDLLSISSNLFLSDVWPLVHENLVQALPTDRITNYNKISPLIFKQKFVSVGDKIYGIPFAAGSYALAYNADLVDEAPTSWNVLWNVRSQNQYSLTSDYSECNIYLTALAMGIAPEDVYDPDIIFQKVPLNEFRSKLNDLAKNARSFWESTANVEEMSTLKFTTTWGFAVQQANMQGQNWKFAKPKEGLTAYFDSWAISTTVPPDSIEYDLCIEWINHCHESQVQVKAVRDWGMTPVITGLKDQFTPEEIEYFHIENEEFWNAVSFWEILRPVNYHTTSALWKVAMSLKMNPASKFVSFQDEQQERIDSGVNRYIRGKKIAAETRQNRAARAGANQEIITFPSDRHYELTLYSLSKGMTKAEVIQKAVEEYIKNNPIE